MNGPNTHDDERFADQAKELFDDSVERLDAATLSQLNQRRQAALAAASSEGSRVHWGRWLPAAGVTAAAVVAVVMMQGTPTGVELPPDEVTDFELLLSEDNLEMIEELEFYDWLEFAADESADNVG